MNYYTAKPLEVSMRECINCNKTWSLDKHHIIHGHGKRKACETRESLIDICRECHQCVHGFHGRELDTKLKLGLQAVYFKLGYDEEKVRNLMGGKLFLVGGEIWGKKGDKECPPYIH
jgi:hypothetical protein